MSSPTSQPNPGTPLRKTKIICTIGPATQSLEMLERLYHAGMNLVRLNMSHGDHASHEQVIKAIRTLNKRYPGSGDPHRRYCQRAQPQTGRYHLG